MWRKCDGFFLSDLLLSLSALLVSAVIFTPMMIRIITYSEQTQLEHEAVKVLYEYLIDVSARAVLPESQEVTSGGKRFEIHTNDNGEVCVKYEDMLMRAQEACEIFQ